APFRDVINDGFLRIELVTQLVEICHFQARTDQNLPTARLQVTQQQLEQSGLTRAIGTEQANPIATLQDQREIPEQRFSPSMGETHLLGDDDLLTGLVGRFQLETGLTL